MFSNIEAEMAGVVTVETVYSGLANNTWNQVLWADPRRIGIYLVTYSGWGTFAFVPTDVGTPQTPPASAALSQLIKNQWQFALDGPVVTKNWWCASPNFAGEGPLTVYEQWQIKEPSQPLPAPSVPSQRTVVSPQALIELAKRVRMLGGQNV